MLDRFLSNDGSSGLRCLVSFLMSKCENRDRGAAPWRWKRFVCLKDWLAVQPTRCRPGSLSAMRFAVGAVWTREPRMTDRLFAVLEQATGALMVQQH